MFVYRDFHWCDLPGLVHRTLRTVSMVMTLIEDVMREIWPFCLVMFGVLMAVTYVPAISLWLVHAHG
jgi:TRAP-type C4-dicarboxylate transport system permease large subunit